MDRRDLTPTRTPAPLGSDDATPIRSEQTIPCGPWAGLEPTRVDVPAGLRAEREAAALRRARRIMAWQLPAAIRSLAGARALYRATEGQGGTAERLDRAEAAYWQIAS